MDLVSFETREEYDWIKGFVNGKLIIPGIRHLKLDICSQRALFLDQREIV